MDVLKLPAILYVCAGLTASGQRGYDPTDPDAVELVRLIDAAALPADLVQWFRSARTGQVAVNPYWPRGSTATCACLFLTADGRLNQDALFGFLQSTGSTDPIGEADVRRWIRKLPAVLRSMAALPAMEPLWEAYVRIVDRRAPAWEDMLRRAARAADRFYAGCGPELVFVPALHLQYNADFVRIGSRIYTIAASPQPETVLHEALHTAVAAHHDVMKAYAAQHGLNGLADRARMMELGYLRDDSIDSVAHVLEECLVRALSVVLSGGPEARLREHAAYGCTSVPWLGQAAAGQPPTAATLGAWLRAALERRS